MYCVELAAAGFSVRAAGSAEDALERVLEQAPDVLVTDLVLPGMSGMSLCRQMKRLHLADQTKIIAVTARCSPQELEETQRAGLDSVLPKPCLPEELIATISRLLDVGRALRHHSTIVRTAAAERADRSSRLRLQSRVLLLASGIAGVFVPCPGCRAPMAWRETNRVSQIRYDYFHPYEAGCGEYLFDHLRRRLIKLRP